MTSCAAFSATNRSELQQKYWAELAHPDDLAADVAQFNRAMAGDSVVSATCLRCSNGSGDHLIGLLQDINAAKTCGGGDPAR